MQRASPTCSEENARELNKEAFKLIENEGKLLTKYKNYWQSRNLPNPGIILCHEYGLGNIMCGDGSVLDVYYIALEFLGIGHLLSVFNACRELFKNMSFLATFMEYLLCATKFIHTLGDAHLDLKFDNILIGLPINGRFRIRISDFGGSQTKDGDGYIIRSTHTEKYAPPELRSHLSESGIGPEQYSGEKVDVHCLGTILYGLLTGEFPYQFPLLIHNYDTLIFGALKGQHIFFKTMVYHMLHPNSTVRCTLDQAIDMFARVPGKMSQENFYLVLNKYFSILPK